MTAKASHLSASLLARSLVRAGRVPSSSGWSHEQGSLCVYTRKSSEEGLEQEFNSLDAQREACLAYVASQKHEGWSASRERYDDGGFSAGAWLGPG
jgi:hypothetical protein